MITECFLWFSPNCMDRPRMKCTNKNRNKQKNRHHDHLNMLFSIVKSYCLCCCEVLGPCLGPQLFSDLTLGLFPPQTNVYCLISYRAGAWDYPIFLDFSKSLVSKWRIVRVKTRTKAFFLEEILINIPSENLPKLSKERMQYFCHALKLNFSMNRSTRTEDDYKLKQCINFTQQRILCLILPASVK